MEFIDFSGGLVRDTDPTSLQPNQVQDAQNVVFGEKRGVVKTRRGYTTINDLTYLGVTDIFYQNSLETPGIIAVGASLLYPWTTTAYRGLWVGDQLIGFSFRYITQDADEFVLTGDTSGDYQNDSVSFTEYLTSILLADGNENYRYADDMGCTLAIATSVFWEEHYIGTWSAVLAQDDYAVIRARIACPYFFYSSGDITTSQYSCSYVWERQLFAGETVTPGKVFMPLEVDDSTVKAGVPYSANRFLNLTITHYNQKQYFEYISLPVSLGVLPLTGTPETTDTGEVGNPDGTYTYKVTCVNRGGFESNEGNVTNPPIAVSSKQILLTEIARGIQTDIASRRIYRIEHGGAIWKYVGEISNNYDTTYTDDVADFILGNAIPLVNTVPPPFGAIHTHKDRLYGSRRLAFEEVWFCNSRSEWQYFDSNNFELFGAHPTDFVGLASLGPYLIVFQSLDSFLYDTVSQPSTIANSPISVSPHSDAVVFQLNNAIIIGTVTAVFSFTSSEVKEITKAIRPIFDQYSDEDERIDPDYLSNMRIVTTDRDVIISYTRTGQTTNDRTIHIRRKSGIVEGILTVGFLDLTVDKVGQDIYGLTEGLRIVKLLNSDDDNGTDIDWYFQTKDDFNQSSVSSKQGDFCVADCNPNGGTITIEVYYDGTLVQTITATGASRTTKRWMLPKNKIYNRRSFKVSGSGKQYFYSLRADSSEGGI